MHRSGTAAAILLLLAGTASAQDQQLGARTKAMGGSYTAFEDDPVSIWLNPAGIATQPSSAAIAYQTYTTYPLHRKDDFGVVTFSAEAETTLVDPALLPSYVGMVLSLGSTESPWALGLCYARPYVLNYSFDQVSDPFQTTFTADSNMQESFSRFRAALAKDFRFSEPGASTWFTHLSVGIGLDAGFERWEFSGTENVTDNATSYGAGFGLLLGLYDNTEDLKFNLGLAYATGIEYSFSIDPDIFPAFDMPAQLNVGATAYLLKGLPLRITLDFQFISWSEVAVDPTFAGQPGFEDSFNYSLGLEYRVAAGAGVSLYPRLGFRHFDAPWEDKDDLPVTGNYRLVLDTKAEAFNVTTLGLGLSWTGEGGKSKTVNFALEVGGDSYNWALDYTFEL